jgi:hypothetical protein
LILLLLLIGGAHDDKKALIFWVCFQVPLHVFINLNNLAIDASENRVFFQVVQNDSADLLVGLYLYSSLYEAKLNYSR